MLPPWIAFHDHPRYVFAASLDTAYAAESCPAREASSMPQVIGDSTRTSILGRFGRMKSAKVIASVAYTDARKLHDDHRGT